MKIQNQLALVSLCCYGLSQCQAFTLSPMHSVSQFSSKSKSSIRFMKRHEMTEGENDNMDSDNSSIHKISLNKNENNNNRRQFLQSLGSSALLTTIATATATTTTPQSASAYSNYFPDTIELSNDGVDKRQFKKDQITSQNPTPPSISSSSNINLRTDDIAPILTWGLASWLLAGSRSNPLVTPLANVLYDTNDKENNQWLTERNQGLFAPVPLPLNILLGIVFISFGILINLAILALEGGAGDADVSLQLAGVSLIGGGALELGRIASGEKSLTKEDNDRAIQLMDDFDEFAAKRLMLGSKNCHRSEVTRAFRRYFAKYRMAENPQNPEYDLSDLEIERMIKDWTRRRGLPEVSNAGFLSGVQLNDASDVLLL